MVRIESLYTQTVPLFKLRRGLNLPLLFRPISLLPRVWRSACLTCALCRWVFQSFFKSAMFFTKMDTFSSNQLCFHHVVQVRIQSCVSPWYCGNAYRTPYRLFNFTTASILMAEKWHLWPKNVNLFSMAAILKSSSGNTRVCALYTFHVVHVGTCKLVSFLIRRTAIFSILFRNTRTWHVRIRECWLPILAKNHKI